MTKQLETVNLQGKAYAQVATRIKEFRTDNPNGLIETTPTFMPNGQVLFKARAVKDKSNPSSAEGTGHAVGVVGKDKKDFEKLETISVGRALAMLGYMASGEVASSEEMEEFLEHKEIEKAEMIENIRNEVAEIYDVVDLKDYYQNHKGMGAEVDAIIIARRDELKNLDKPVEPANDIA